MHTAEARLSSVSPYSQSRFHDTPKLDKEGPDDHEARTWREQCHATSKGEIFIPPMAFKLCITEAARMLGIKIPGKGNSRYHKHFLRGVLVTEPLLLGVQKDDIEGEWFFVNADGVRGSGKRVKRCFPVIPEWNGTVQFHILDDTLTKDVFQHHLEEAGKFVGIGRFRPENGGFYGRFAVEELRWI
jgi:hypothetical protein